jgi:replicative superfamily II helicase
MHPEGLKRLRVVEYGPQHPLDAISESFMPKIYDRIGYHLKDWQAKAFDTMRKGNDLFIKARTGAGKTAAVLSMLALKPEAIILFIVPLKAIMSDSVLSQMMVDSQSRSRSCNEKGSRPS